ncbi:MAG: winged helix-turn-helix domain-containing protein [Candidatus Hodarchaeales archaeon]
MRRITIDDEEYLVKPVFKLWLEIDRGDGEITVLGKGKTVLLEAIRSEGSIKGAADKLGLNFKTAWRRSMELRESSKGLLLHTKKGGSMKGGTFVTPTGETFLKVFHDLENTIASIIAEKDNTKVTIQADIKQVQKKETGRTSLKVMLPEEIEIELCSEDHDFKEGDKINLQIRM